MQLTMLKSKIHRATVTEADLNYIGSITIDRDLMDAAHILEFEQVHVVNVTNGERFVTYVIEGEPGSGTVCVNGAAARLVQRGDVVIIIAYAQLSPDEAAAHRPSVVFVDAGNHPGTAAHS